MSKNTVYLLIFGRSRTQIVTATRWKPTPHWSPHSGIWVWRSGGMKLWSLNSGYWGILIIFIIIYINITIIIIIWRYPHWRCQLLKPRKMKFIDKNSSFISLSVNDQLQMNTNEIESQIKAQKTRNNGSDDLLGVLLMDPINSPLLFPANSGMRGDHIKVPFHKGWRIFTIKIHQFRHLKSDPNSDCMEYSEDNTYGSCVR